jgi:hypothetical protein
MQPQKLAPQTEVRCGLQKYNTSEKRAKTLTIFFFIFLNFLAILIKPNRVKQSIVERGQQLQDEKVLIEKHVELWVGTQYDCKD